MCYSNTGGYYQPWQNWQSSTSCYRNCNNSSYAIVLVLFILLVIVIGSRCNSK